MLSILFLALTAIPWPGMGVCDGLEWSAVAGAGGFRLFQGWSYLVIELENGPEDKTGEFVLRCPGQTEARYHLPFQVPGKTSRRYFVYFQAGDWECESSLHIAGRQVGKSQPITLSEEHATGSLMEIGLITHVDTALTGIFEKTPYVRAAWSQLPNDPAGYEAVEWLFLTNTEESADLSHGQNNALRTWIETGGKVMVFLGRESALPDGILKEMFSLAGIQVSGRSAPIQFQELPTVLSLKGPIAAASVARIDAPQRYVVWREGSRIISAVAPFGWGRIGVCAVNPAYVSGMPTNRVEFWEFAGGVRLKQAGMLPSVSEDKFVGRFGPLLLPGKAAIPLSIGWVILYLVSFLMVSGAMQLWLLKQGVSYLKSLALFFASIVFFCVIADFIVRRKKGEELWQRDIGVVTVSPTGASRGKMFSTFFVPTSGELKCQLGQDVIAAPLQSGSQSIIEQEGSRRSDCWMVPEGTEVSLHYRQWDIVTMMTSCWDMPARSATPFPLPEGLPTKLRKGHLLTDSGVYSLGDLDLSQDFDLPTGTPPMTLRQMGERAEGAYRPGQDHSTDEMETILLGLCVGQPARVIEFDIRETVKRGHKILVGFSEHPRLRPQLQSPLSGRTSVCLLRMMVSER